MTLTIVHNYGYVQHSIGAGCVTSGHTKQLHDASAHVSN